MKSISKRALVLLGSSLFGATLWLASFIAVIVGSAHLYKPQDIVPGELLVIGGEVPLGRNLEHIRCRLCTPPILAKDNFKVGPLPSLQQHGGRSLRRA